MEKKSNIKENKTAIDNETDFLIGFIIGYFLNIFSIFYTCTSSNNNKYRLKGIMYGFKSFIIFILLIVIINFSLLNFKLKVENNLLKKIYGPVIFDKNKGFALKYTSKEFEYLKNHKGKQITKDNHNKIISKHKKRKNKKRSNKKRKKHNKKILN